MIESIWHFIWRVTGTRPSGWTNFWGGFFSDTTIFTGVAVLYFHHKCEDCMRWGKYMDKHFHRCATHHPKVDHAKSRKRK